MSHAPASSSPRPPPGSGKTTVATGLMAAFARARARRRAAQGRPGLHRPRLPRAGRRPARPQPRPGAASARSWIAPAVRARRRRRRHRRGRGRDGPVRRRAPARRARPPPRTWPSCSARRWCWWWTPPRSAGRSPRWCTASRPSTRAVRIGRGDPQPGRLRPARGAAARGAGRGRRARCWARCAATDAVAAPSPAPRAWCPAAERRRRGRGDRSRALAALVGAGVDLDAVAGPAPARAPPLRRGPVGRRPTRSPTGVRRRAGRWSRSPAGPAFTFSVRRDTPSCSPPPAPRSSPRPAARRAAARRHARRWSSAAASPRCTRPSCPRTSRCARPWRALAGRGAPVAAECAGCSTCAGPSTAPPMCGVARRATARDDRPADAGLPGGGRARRQRLAAGRDAGERARVPPHRGRASPPGRARLALVGERHVEGFVRGGVHASYLHVHWAAEPVPGAAVRGLLRGRRGHALVNVVVGVGASREVAAAEVLALVHRVLAEAGVPPGVRNGAGDRGRQGGRAGPHRGGGAAGRPW